MATGRAQIPTLSVQGRRGADTCKKLSREAFAAARPKPYDHVIRGGTDGSRLTELGLPTPNLFCGEHNAHGPLEWVAVQDMESAVTACTQLAELWERKS